MALRPYTSEGTFYAFRDEAAIYRQDKDPTRLSTRSPYIARIQTYGDGSRRCLSRRRPPGTEDAPVRVNETMLAAGVLIGALVASSAATAEGPDPAALGLPAAMLPAAMAPAGPLHAQ